MQAYELPPVLTFWPPNMGQVDRFVMLHGSTYSFTDFEKRFVGGVGAHFNKVNILHGLAQRLKPNLAIDNAQIRERGHSGAENANEVTAVLEATILELYSCVDCVAEVIYAIYRHKHVRKLKQSTSGLFRDFEKLGTNFPEPLRAALRSATWFAELRGIRDELTHRQTGNVHLDEKTGGIFYMHRGMMQGERAFIIEDIFGWLAKMVEAVNLLLGQVFHYLNSQLLPGAVDVVCGFNQGRLLMRIVNPAEELTFDSGTCRSYPWFQQPDNPGCPFSQDCGAYKRTQAEAGGQGPA